jgi:hypothetical protein
LTTFFITTKGNTTMAIDNKPDTTYDEYHHQPMGANTNNQQQDALSSSDEEKNVNGDNNVVEPLDEDPEFSYKEQRKIIHRIDKRLVTMTGVMYCVSLMDRSNLPNVRLTDESMQLQKDSRGVG